MSKSTTLASARVNGSEIIIELLSPPADTPPVILVTWPPRASAITRALQRGCLRHGEVVRSRRNRTNPDPQRSPLAVR